MSLSNYTVKIRLNGNITYVDVLAVHAGQARNIVMSQYGHDVVVLQVILK